MKRAIESSPRSRCKQRSPNKLQRGRCGGLLAVLTVFGLSSVGCTYGQVTWGDPKPNVFVSISNCDAKSWSANTNSSGWYEIDGYEDDDDIVTEGLILIMTRVGSIEKFDMAFQTYEPCPDDDSKLCDRHDIDWGFVPLSGWEWNAWYDWLDVHNTNNIYDFFAFCGYGARSSGGAVGDGPTMKLESVDGPEHSDEDTAIERARTYLQR